MITGFAGCSGDSDTPAGDRDGPKDWLEDTRDTINASPLLACATLFFWSLYDCLGSQIRIADLGRIDQGRIGIIFEMVCKAECASIVQKFCVCP